MRINNTAKDTQSLQNFLQLKSQSSIWELLFKDLQPFEILLELWK